jgi:hypothetical protein
VKAGSPRRLMREAFALRISCARRQTLSSTIAS